MDSTFLSLTAQQWLMVGGGLTALELATGQLSAIARNYFEPKQEHPGVETVHPSKASVYVQATYSWKGAKRLKGIMKGSNDIYYLEIEGVPQAYPIQIINGDFPLGAFRPRNMIGVFEAAQDGVPLDQVWVIHEEYNTHGTPVPIGFDSSMQAASQNFAQAIKDIETRNKAAATETQTEDKLKRSQQDFADTVKDLMPKPKQGGGQY